MQLCCHCLDCQDALQTDYAAIAFFKIDGTTVSGELAEKSYVAESGSKTCRQHCEQCNTPMFDRSEGFPKLLGVMMGQIDAPFEPLPSCHVFVRDKKAHISIPEGMKQYETGLG